MSRDGGESQLKSLQGADKLLLHKLKGVGIESIADLATTTASELLEDYYSRYYDHLPLLNCCHISTIFPSLEI
jgi:hypothetical protein